MSLEALEKARRFGPLLPGGDIRALSPEEAARLFSVRETPIGPVYVLKDTPWARASPHTLVRAVEQRVIIEHFEEMGYRYLGRVRRGGSPGLRFASPRGKRLEVGLLRRGRKANRAFPVWIDFRPTKRRRGGSRLLPFSELYARWSARLKGKVQETHFDGDLHQEGLEV